jgi:hypothetical protein
MKNKEVPESVQMMLPFIKGAETLMHSEKPLQEKILNLYEEFSPMEVRISLVIAQGETMRRFFTHREFATKFFEGLSNKGLI